MSRLTYFAKRIALMVPVLVFGTSLTYIILYAGPINPAVAIAGANAPADQIRAIEQQLGLTKPLWAQYIDFMINMFTFDLGQSWVISPNTDVSAVIAQRFPRTVWLGFWAILIPLFIGIPLGFYAGLNPNSWGDYAASLGGIVWRAAPNFWLAVILLLGLSNSEQYLFGFNWKTFIVDTPQLIGAPPLNNLTNPTEFLKALKRILPASFVLGSASLGNELRIGRTAMLETKNSNYVEMARAKGVSDRLLVWKHMFRNALIPLVPVITAEATILLGGSLIVEEVFSINGIGRLFYQAIINGDIPLAAALAFIFVLLLVIINIMQDFLYTVLDPRVSFEE
ncbi:ABC transporter permease [Halococcus saccharolyticus]|uniref:ABC transporter n=1 Tax=Halococcus saccharolyticus DSM 5350 TaxID=1227455 RepID=M0ME93_9EURY|nr:ABC transporter permease [Halococcus saccharolyticus]EMA42735.1 ABC transporter [Halococcus saccharolyticus DSM 5350]